MLLIKNKEIYSKLLEKKNDENLKKEFENLIYLLSTKEILWASQFIHNYPKKFIFEFNTNKYIIFLLHIEEKFDWIYKKILAFIENQIGKYEHPYITYYYLQKFWEEIHESDVDKTLSLAAKEIYNEISNKSRSRKKTKKENKEDKEKVLYNYLEIEQKFEKIKKKLKIPKQWKELKSDGLLWELLQYFEELSLEKYNLEKDKVNLEIELERLKNPEIPFLNIKKDYEDLKNKFQQLQKNYLEEKSKNEVLEKEIKRLTELIIENPKLNEFHDEHEVLKKEYQLLSEKYDLLVSKNIELRNIIEQQSHVKTLQEVLNKIRDRINKILKTGGFSEEVMIIKIKQEIEELQRARIYLGKALYDIGLLYFRLGRKEEAILELKAAKELGVEDPEVNRIINLE
ncbi:MAG: hypothetical protein ACK4UJ_05875 [Leptonema sp. (in: bacteria)]